MAKPEPPSSGEPATPAERDDQDLTAEETSRWATKLYDELRVVARRFMRSERADHTLEPTGLVHEAFVRLREGVPVAWRDRTHFLAVAAGQMRRVLVDHARARQAKKRGGSDVRVSLAESVAPNRPVDIDVLALNEVIERLAGLNARQGAVVELRVFGGLTVAEAAAHLEVSKRTVVQDWQFARAWLLRELGQSAGDQDGP